MTPVVAKTLLDWEPTVQLQEGLKLTVENFRDRMNKSTDSAILGSRS
jgi:UDP-glucuronate decarboxylase